MPTGSNKNSKKITRSRRGPLLSRQRFSRRQLIAIVALLFGVGLVLVKVFAASPPGEYGSIETDQVNRINQARAANGLPALQHIDCFHSIAIAWAKQMAAQNNLYHNQNLGAQVDSGCGGYWTHVGENIGVGGNSADLFTAFMNSPEHKANILNPNFSKVGVGAYIDAKGTLWITQDFGLCGTCTAAWSTAARIPADPVPVTVSGRAYNPTTGVGFANVKIETCTGTYPVTDASGKWSFTINPGSSFCARVYSGAPDANKYAGPTTVNNPEYATAGTYEYQMAGSNCYHNSSCSGSFVNWDRNSDSGYDFKFASPPPKRIYTDSSGKGYLLDGWGKLWPLSGAPAVANPSSASWKGWDIARSVAVKPDLSAAYELDGYGGIHAMQLGSNPVPPAAQGAPYWGWDIARDIVVTDWSKPAGYVLDGYGGIHPFGGAASPTGGAYHSGWDIVHRFAYGARGGVQLDGFGGLPTFNSQPAVNGSAYWNGWDIARAIALNPNGNDGYVLDGYGGIHPFNASGVAQPAGVSGAAYWNGQDIAKDLFVSDWNKRSGYTIDVRGGIHPFNSAPAPSGGPYW